MRARITRTVPNSHSRFALAPGNAALREPFDQVAMTELLRTDLEACGFEGFHFEASRRHPSDGDQKKYQFDVRIPGDASSFSSDWNASWDGVIELFATNMEAIEDGETFEGEGEAPHSAIAAVGNIVS